MNNLLQRMLAVDKEADALVQQAEAEAASLAEDTRQQIARERQEAQITLQEECDVLLQSQLQKARQAAEEILQKDDRDLDARKAEFSRKIVAKAPQILGIILGTRTDTPPAS